MTEIRESTAIEGVYIAELQSHGDQRGRFTEIYRKEWFPQRSWDALQWSRSESQKGTLRGLHYHHHQVDYWHCGMGLMRVGLLDLRQGSSTRGQGQVIELNQEALAGVFIPVGVAHGFYAVTDLMLFYLVDRYYDNTDEFGVAWDDPDGGLDWGVEGQLILSERDRVNPRMRDLPAGELPE
jgi:dTDP-4-dehydrorhamnose 3,5-epimerase